MAPNPTIAKVKKDRINTDRKFLIKKIFSLLLISSQMIAFPECLNALEIEKPSKRHPLPSYLNKKIDNDYILGKSDQIEIIISQETPELNKQYIIDGNGTIIMPRIHRIYVSGLTLSELTNILNKKYTEFIINPSVEVRVTKYRNVNVSVKGGVINPGLYTFDLYSNDNRTNDDEPCVDCVNTGFYPTLFDSIRRAGGVNLYANLTNITVTRLNTISNGGGRVKADINFLNFITTGESINNIRIFDGDIINIEGSTEIDPEQIKKLRDSNLNDKFIEVNVLGMVEEPGKVKVSNLSSLNNAIDMAGGTKILKGEVKFVRFTKQGDIDKRKISINKSTNPGEYNNPYLMSGDIIIVSKSGIKRTTEVLNEVFAPIQSLTSALLFIELLKRKD